jgi:hypothetical protein
MISYIRFNYKQSTYCSLRWLLKVGSRWHFVHFPLFLQSEDITVDFPFLKCFMGRRMPATPQPPWLQFTCLRVLSLELVSSCVVVIASRHGCLTKTKSPVVFLTRNATQGVYSWVAEEEPIKSSVSVACPSHKKAPSLLHTLWSDEC